ncbi:MAG TPA: low temperature requirement protein A [Acidimicrobiales bacterium]
MAVDLPLPTRRSDDPAPTVGFLELFYDLVFVASTMVLSNAFSEELTWSWAGLCCLSYVLVWMLWFHTTLLSNVERRDDLGHRCLVMFQMFLIVLTILAFVDREATNNDYLGVTYGMAVVTVAVMYHRVIGQNPQAADWARMRRNRLLLAGVLLMMNTGLPDWADSIVFLVAIAILVVPSSLGSAKRSPLPAVDVHHLSERAALLTLIMCGEAFVKVSLVVSSGSLSHTDVVAIVVEFVVVFALFWTYFDDVPKAGIRAGTVRGELWMLSHLPLQIGIVAIAIGMSKFLDIEHGVHDEVVGILGTGWTSVYLGLALIGVFGRREPVGPLLALRLGTAAAAALLALVDWYVFWIEPNTFVGILAALAVLHAVAAKMLRERTTVVDAHPVVPVVD